MSEAYRARFMRVTNRLEELRAKHGHEDGWPERGPPPEDADSDPSWGPLGSLARAHLHPLEYAHLMALHEQMLQLERSRRGAADGVTDEMPSEVQPAPAEPTEPEPRQQTPIPVWRREDL